MKYNKPGKPCSGARLSDTSPLKIIIQQYTHETIMKYNKPEKPCSGARLSDTSPLKIICDLDHPFFFVLVFSVFSVFSVFCLAKRHAYYEGPAACQWRCKIQSCIKHELLLKIERETCMYSESQSTSHVQCSSPFLAAALASFAAPLACDLDANVVQGPGANSKILHPLQEKNHLLHDFKIGLSAGTAPHSWLPPWPLSQHRWPATWMPIMFKGREPAVRSFILCKKKPSSS